MYELTVGPLDQVKLGSTSFPDETAFDFNANSMYPGAIVQGKANYIDSGQLVTNPLQPGAGSLNLEGAILRPGSSPTVHVAAATQSNLTQGINTLFNQAFSADQSAVWNCTLDTVTSSNSAAYSAGLSFGYGSMVSVSNTFSSANNSSANHVLARCVLAFFTVAYMPDASPSAAGNSAFFDPSVTLADASKYIATGNPPLFIQSVTYGAQLFLLADSQSSSDQIKDALKAAFNYAGASGSVNFTAEQTATMNSMEVHILAMGGRASAQKPLVSDLLGPNVASGLVPYLTETLEISASANGVQEIGVPISYKLSYLDFTPVVENETLYGTPAQTSDSPLTFATIYFQQDGNGKGKDTLVDVAIEDGAGKAIAFLQIGPNTQWGNSSKSPTLTIPIVAQGTEGALRQGQIHMTIHTASPDTWKFTAYLKLGYKDSSTAFGTFSDELTSKQSTVTVSVANSSGTPTAVTHSGKELYRPLAFVH